MPISSSKYVNVDSAIAANQPFSGKSFGSRQITTNTEFPSGTIVSFNNSTEVINYFGSNSDEAKRAQFYFGFRSKNSTRPREMSFARWNDTETASQIIGDSDIGLLTSFTSITDGSLIISIGDSQASLSTLDIDAEGITSYAELSTFLTTQLNALPSPFDTSVVTFDGSRNRFNFDAVTFVPGEISVESPSGGIDLAPLLGWNANARYSMAFASETITEMLTRTTEEDNNFGSFSFVQYLTIEQYEEAAIWNNARNFEFILHVSSLKSEAVTFKEALNNYNGTSVTVRLSTEAFEYPELLPAAIQASINRNNRNSDENFMFYSGALTPSVTTDLESDEFDAERINYYGKTQRSGNKISFYQRGILLGTNPIAMNIYAGASWLKDTAETALLNLLITAPFVPGNETGNSQIISVIVANVIEPALNNGVISIGRALSAENIAFITQVTGNEEAYRQVQSSGYWINSTISDRPAPGGGTEAQANYLIVYANNDTVNFVEGRHIGV